MLAVRLRVDKELSTYGAAIGGENLRLDTVKRRVADAVKTLPGDDEAAIGKGVDIGGDLKAVRFAVDKELWTGGRAAGIKPLCLDAKTGWILVTVAGFPGDDKAPIGKRRDGGLGLNGISIGVDEKLATDLRSIIGKDLGLIPVSEESTLRSFVSQVATNPPWERAATAGRYCAFSTPLLMRNSWPAGVPSALYI